MTPGRWTAYAAAGAASALTCANSAEAEIHYSGNVGRQLTGNARASLPLSNDASLVFINIFGGTTFLQHFLFVIKGVTSGSAWGGPIHHSWIVPLGPGENVSAGRFYSAAGDPDRGIIFTFFSDGYFQPYYGVRGYIGFRFNTGKGTQYGWARIQTKMKDFVHYRAQETIKDYAWGDVGDAILTGQKHSLQPANANSVPGSLGLLAFGAQGLDAWRTQRTQKSN